jgi:hypothetical protein
MTAPRPPHILVVDAESDVFELLAPGFAEQLYRITHVTSVAAAKAILDDAVIDVVLVDARLLNAVGMMLVGQAAFGVPLLPSPTRSRSIGSCGGSARHCAVPISKPLLWRNPPRSRRRRSDGACGERRRTGIPFMKTWACAPSWNTPTKPSGSPL